MHHLRWQVLTSPKGAMAHEIDRQAEHMHAPTGKQGRDLSLATTRGPILYRGLACHSIESAALGIYDMRMALREAGCAWHTGGGWQCMVAARCCVYHCAKDANVCSAPHSAQKRCKQVSTASPNGSHSITVRGVARQGRLRHACEPAAWKPLQEGPRLAARQQL